MSKSPTPRATKRKALPPIYVVVSRRGRPVSEGYYENESDARDEVMCGGDRIVKYAPVPPRARRGK